MKIVRVSYIRNRPIISGTKNNVIALFFLVNCFTFVIEHSASAKLRNFRQHVIVNKDNAFIKRQYSW